MATLAAESAEAVSASILGSWISLLQTVLWVGAVIVIAVIFRKSIETLRAEIDTRLRGGSTFKLGILELGQRINTVESQVVHLQDRVARAFVLSMSNAMFSNLVKLASGSFGRFEKNRGLERELRHLRDIGCIEIASVDKIPLSGSDLSEYVTVTASGHEFVALRRELREDSRLLSAKNLT
jgi:hypothetical protein